MPAIMLQIAEAKPAILFGNGNTVQTKLTHLGPEVAGELVRLVDLGRDRSDLVAGETLRGFTDGIRHLAEAKI